MDEVRLGLMLFSESNVVDMVADHYDMLGISAQEAGKLRELFGKRYQLIEHDRVFHNAPSALPYCYSAQKPAEGLAFVYSPKKLNSKTPALVFLHGYGGSFVWSQQLLAEAFPDDLIICPAYGISSGTMPPAYLLECLDAVGARIGQRVQRPVLMGLSAGGFGAARIFGQATNKFSRLIVLAAYPLMDALPYLNKNMSVRYLVGSREYYVQSGVFNRCMQTIGPRVGDLRFQSIADGDHFFMLEKKEETMKVLRDWVEEPAPSATPAKKESRKAAR